MQLVLEWFYARWSDIVVPAAILFAALIAALWLRKVTLEAFARWLRPGEAEDKRTVLRLLRRGSLWWAVILSAYLALLVSSVPQTWKGPGSRALWSLFLATVAVAAAQLTGELVKLYGARLKLPTRSGRGYPAPLTMIGKKAPADMGLSPGQKPLSRVN